MNSLQISIMLQVQNHNQVPVYFRNKLGINDFPVFINYYYAAGIESCKRSVDNITP